MRNACGADANAHRGTIGGWAPAELTVVFDTYWRLAAERQAIFVRRLNGLPSPWTEDPILQSYKFTNAYRASDRVSQYLMKHVIYSGDQSPEEVFFRTLLFKIFNRIGTWELLRERLGAVTYSGFSVERYRSILDTAMADGSRLYSAAYIMPPGARFFGYGRKHANHLALLDRLMKDGVPLRIAETTSMQKAFHLLRSYPMMGNFLAYQYVTDINYSPLTDFSEMEFVVAGPGARDGIRKCFRSLGGLTEEEVIRLVADRQEEEFARLDIQFQTLWGRRLQLIDCQNLFCEVGKYARVAHPEIKGISGRTRIKQRYRPNPAPLPYFYPPKWGLNKLIQESLVGGRRA